MKGNEAAREGTSWKVVPGAIGEIGEIVAARYLSAHGWYPVTRPLSVGFGAEGKRMLLTSRWQIGMRDLLDKLNQNQLDYLFNGGRSWDLVVFKAYWGKPYLVEVKTSTVGRSMRSAKRVPTRDDALKAKAAGFGGVLLVNVSLRDEWEVDVEVIELGMHNT